MAQPSPDLNGSTVINLPGPHSPAVNTTKQTSTQYKAHRKGSYGTSAGLTGSSYANANGQQGSFGPNGHKGQPGPPGLTSDMCVKFSGAAVSAYATGDATARGTTKITQDGNIMSYDGKEWQMIAGLDKEEQRAEKIKKELCENFPDAAFDLMMKGLI